MIGRIVAVAIGLASGAGLSQAPEFVQQYNQRLGGHMDELSGFVSRFDADAAREGLSRDQALAEFVRPGSRFLTARGADASTMIRRYERISSQKAALDRARPFERLWVFSRDMDEDIARATWNDYRPAVPVTVEGAAHAGAGFLAGLLGAGLVGRLLGGGRRRRSRYA